jgi:hypothetical protein
MRKTIYSLIKDIDPAIPADRWHQLGSVDETPEKPFGVYRLSGTAPGVTRRSKSRVVRLEVWVHDTPGSYTRIDGVLNAVENVFDAVTHASAAEGESISQIDFDARSPDLDDTGFRTICKMSSFTVIGKGQ